jgi:hypothetical protein
MAMYEVEAIDATKNCVNFCGYALGPYSDLAAIQDGAAFLSSGQDVLINMVNKEL